MADCLCCCPVYPAPLLPFRPLRWLARPCCSHSWLVPSRSCAAYSDPLEHSSLFLRISDRSTARPTHAKYEYSNKSMVHVELCVLTLSLDWPDLTNFLFVIWLSLPHSVIDGSLPFSRYGYRWDPFSVFHHSIVSLPMFSMLSAAFIFQYSWQRKYSLIGYGMPSIGAEEAFPHLAVSVS